MKLFNKITTLFAGLTMALGVGLVLDRGNKVEKAEAATIDSITIQRGSFSGGTHAYTSQSEWTTKTAIGQETITGKASIYSDLKGDNEDTYIQTRSSNTPHYYNIDQVPGRITNVILYWGNNGTAQTFTIYLSENASFSTAEGGTNMGTLVPTISGASKEIVGVENYHYFLITHTSGTNCMAKIVIEFSVSGLSPAEEAEEFMGRVNDLAENVTLDSGNDIALLKIDYSRLSLEAKALVDLADYASIMEQIEAEYKTLVDEANELAAQPVISMIDLLPNASEINEGNYMNYEEAASDALAAYNMLTEEQRAFVTNYQKLDDLLEAIGFFSPVPVVIVDDIFDKGATLPAAYWTTGGLAAHGTTVGGRTASRLGTKDNYVQIDSFASILSFDDEKTVKKFIVTIVSHTNTTADSSTNLVGVSGLNASGQIINSTKKTFAPRLLVNSDKIDTLETNLATDNNMALATEVIEINGPDIQNVKGLKINLDARGHNLILYKVTVAVLYEPKDVEHSEELQFILDYMDSLDTCSDFTEATYVQEYYDNELTEEEQAIFDNTICAENPLCTMGEKLAYMHHLLGVDNSEEAGLNSLVEIIDSNGKIAAALMVIGVIGLTSILGYYLVLKKKYIA